jgi:protein-tyrosine-phosphatase
MARDANRNKPGSVLFVCTMNAVRSPMAAALLRHLKGQEIHVESAGVEAGALDPLAVETMAEIGIALAHHPHRIEDLVDGCFDLIVALSPEAEGRAQDWCRTSATPVEHWRTADPTAVEGTPEQRRAAYRAVRDTLRRQIAARFG